MADKTYSIGDKIILFNAPSYATCESKNPSSYRTGEFYIYSEKVRHGRLMFTDSAERVKKPSMKCGWINLKDIKE